MNEVIFRVACREDLSAIVALLAHDPLGQKREDYRLPLPSAYHEAFARIDQDPNHELMVLVNQVGDILGTFQLSFLPYLTYQGGQRAQLEAVRVHESQRGLGFGTHIIHWAIMRARTRGAHVLQLTTDKKRPEAIKFYEKMGFVASHEGMKYHL